MARHDCFQALLELVQLLEMTALPLAGALLAQEEVPSSVKEVVPFWFVEVVVLCRQALVAVPPLVAVLLPGLAVGAAPQSSGR